jgi:hypothetical protein
LARSDEYNTVESSKGSTLIYTHPSMIDDDEMMMDDDGDNNDDNDDSDDDDDG